MPLVVSIILILAGSITLVFAVNLFIESSSKIAKKFGVSGYTISFLLVSVATSLPEVVVAVTSALEKTPILSFGDAIGSNVTLVTLVLALPILINTDKGISTRTVLHSKDAYYAILFGILPVLFAIDGTISRVDGIIMLVLYTIYMSVVWRRSKGVEKIIEKIEQVNLWKQFVIFIFSLLLLLGASETIVQTALYLSSSMGWGLAFIGVSMTAIGTSLPEIAFTITAGKGRFHQQILGDIVGSVVANSTAVLGTAAVIYPIQIGGEIGNVGLIVFFVLIMLLFIGFTRTREKVDKAEAVTLILVYIIFLASQYYLQTSGIKLNL